MNADVLYCVVVRRNGGDQMKSFTKEETAVKESDKLVKLATENNLKNIEIYYSELWYDRHKNKILSDKLVDEDSELLYQA